MKIRKRITKKVDFSPYLTWSLLGWKDEWADEKRFSEIVRVDNISKITNGVVHGLVEKLSKSPFFKKKRCLLLFLRPALAPQTVLPYRKLMKHDFVQKNIHQF